MSYGIAPAKNTKVVTYPNGKTKDIIREVLDANADPLVWAQVFGFAKQFSRTYDGLHDLYWWVKDMIRYVEDPTGVQWIREPARLFADKQGDCKSMTLFLCAVARCMGIPYTIRFVTYSPHSKVVTHVYPIFHLDGRDVIMDAVWTDFDTHKTPFYLKKDYKFMEISRLGSVGALMPKADAKKLKTLANAATHMGKIAKGLRQVYDGVDITKLTEAEAIAYLTGGQVSGIGSSLPAFVLPTLVMDDGVEGVGSWLSQAGDWIKKQATSIVNDIKHTIGSLINWVFKVALKKAGPFFLFAFIIRKVSDRVDAKKEAQQRIVSFVAKTTGTSEAVVMASIADGIKDQTGKTPQQALNAAANGETVAGLSGTGGIGVAPAIIAAVISIIDTILKFFNKPKESAPPVDANAASDPALLAQDAAQAPVANENTGIVPPNVPRQADKQPDSKVPRDNAPTVQNGGKDNSMLWAGAGLVGLYLFSQSKGVGDVSNSIHSGSKATCRNGRYSTSSNSGGCSHNGGLRSRFSDYH